MKQFDSAAYKLGVLGGGQLGKMLIQSAMDFGIEMHVLDPDSNASCSNYCKHFTVGSFQDYDTVYAFGKNLDLLTIEIENVNVAALKQLVSEGVAVYPQPEIIELIQDKGLQKQFFVEHSIPTAPFVFIHQKEELEKYTDSLPAIQKLRKAGYDGRGVFKIKDAEDIANGFESPSILEQKIDFEKELAVIVARNLNGEIKVYDVIEMQFNPTLNLVELLFSPAKITQEQEQQAKEIAVKVMDKLQMVGLLAVELFLTKSGEILVNELAPRPHNSGHHSIEACITSQYEQHLRAILNLPLGETNLLQPAVMINILGDAGFTGPAKYIGLDDVTSVSQVHVHLYSKAITKPNRKMGHITILDAELEKALEKAKFVQSKLKIQA